jgi:glycine cleavage system aminomethyltransferase T/glycine/D-amino acid oxidase-like deaminating enzyme
MRKPLPRSARVVVLGGGVVGCSVAYHLTKVGITDVILLERKQLTSGTTWHAAGLVGQLRGSQNMTKLAKYTAELYRDLEAETGQATGFKQNGSISIATTAGRFEELKRMASMAKVFDLPVDVLTTNQVAERYPLITTEDVIGAIGIPSDGQTNPVDVTQALAKGARNGGAQIFEDTEVTALHRQGDRITGVSTEHGDIAADVVVICGGMWSRELAASVDVHIPLHACEHYYIVTEAIVDLPKDLPVLRDYDAYTYYKEDAGKILLGAFEPKSKPWGMDGVPESFCFDELPYDFDHFQPILETAMRRMPLLETAGIQTFFCGPESFTPDVRYHLGEAPNLHGCFVAAGLNSIGIQSAGGIGKVLADWIRDGHPPMDLWEVDIRRNLPFQTNRRYLHDRVGESLGLLYAMHWPFRQFETGRGVRRSPFYDRLVTAGACHGAAFGWERPNWYAPAGVEPRYEYSYGRQNWFEHSAAEHRAVRENVALFDQSSFAKFRLEGVDAMRELNRVCANDIDVAPGRIVYTQWLNERAGIEADLTITRIDADEFMIVTSGETEVRDFAYLQRRLTAGAGVHLHNETSAFAVLSLMGPRARDLLQSLTSDDLSGEIFRFGWSREIELGYTRVRASRITYVGELGFELYIPTEYALGVYEVIIEGGRAFNLVHAGYHGLNSLRIEKAYRHWGHDVADEDSPLEAGLMFVVRPDKAGGFIGRDALMRKIEQGRERALVQFLLDDPEPMLYHNEPIRRDGAIVGYITSAMYGHTLGAAVGLGYVSNRDEMSDDFILSGSYEIEVAGNRIPAKPSLQALYDPQGLRVRA